MSLAYARPKMLVSVYNNTLARIFLSSSVMVCGAYRFISFSFMKSSFIYDCFLCTQFLSWYALFLYLCSFASYIIIYMNTMISSFLFFHFQDQVNTSKYGHVILLCMTILFLSSKSTLPYCYRLQSS